MFHFQRFGKSIFNVRLIWLLLRDVFTCLNGCFWFIKLLSTSRRTVVAILILHFCLKTWKIIKKEIIFIKRVEQAETQERFCSTSVFLGHHFQWIILEMFFHRTSKKKTHLKDYIYFVSSSKFYVMKQTISSCWN